MLVDKIAKYQVYLYILLAIVVLFVLYKFSNNLLILFGFKESKSDKEEDKDVQEYKSEFEKQLQKEINKLYDSNMRATYPISTYKEMANGMQTAMFDLGADTDYIYKTFARLKNQLDYNLLLKEFGLRPYYTFGIHNGDWTLIKWIDSEFTVDNKKVAEILSKNNIVSAF